MEQRTGEPTPNHLRDIFLSHRGIDKPIVWELVAAIETNEVRGRSLTTWVDEAEIRPGQSIVGMVNEGLERSRFIGVVMTPDYFRSESGWTDAEWHAALFNDPDNRRARVLPLLVKDCPYIPFLLRHLKMIDLRGNRRAQGLRELIATLRDEPLPRPVAYRGQLIQPGGKIDRATLISERAVPESDPDAIPEKLYCNLLPVETLPQYVYVAPIARALRRLKPDGTESLPTKNMLKEVIRSQQEEAGVAHRFMPAFRVVKDDIITFHDLESPDSLLSGIVESDAADVFGVREFLGDEDDRRIVISLFNMAIARALHGRGLIIDDTKRNRVFFPPKDGQRHLIWWTPLKRRVARTVAKPLMRDGKITSWLHQAAYVKAVFLASKLYIQITPTRLLTEDGYRVKGGPTVGRVVVKWIGRERNLQILYHVRFWTSILRRGPGPISLRVGDQRMEVATVPGFIQQAYGIKDDQMNLMALLDQEAPLIAEEEDSAIEVEVEAEEAGEAGLLEDEDLLDGEPDEDADEDDDTDSFLEKEIE